MLAIDCSQIEYRPTSVGRYLTNVLRCWPQDFAATLYFRKTMARLPFLAEKPLDSMLATLNPLRHIEPVWRHILLPRTLYAHHARILFAPGNVPPLTWLPERTVLAIHDLSYKHHPQWFSWYSELRWFPDSYIRRVRHIITTSEFVKQEIMEYYNVPDEQITVATPGVEAHFQPAITIAPPLPGRYLLYWGTITNRRHIPEIIEAFVLNQTERDSQELTFVVIGRDFSYPPLALNRRVAKANRTLGRCAVIWHEYVPEPELLTFLQHAFAVVWLSDYESFALPILEAMACGVPVITSRRTPIAEIAGNAAYYIEDNREVEEIAWCMQALSQNVWLREKLRAQGLAQAKKYTWEKTAERTIKTLKRFL
ncbi:MAG: glycosyltransferase family 1 protein [bacterium]|nr:glycosyltransferase family 1 protein [bacterium]MDZ4296338.1 glycosyltransferase family 1 protein [Patescibacteria group bacterium]